MTPAIPRRRTPPSLLSVLVLALLIATLLPLPAWAQGAVPPVGQATPPLGSITDARPATGTFRITGPANNTTINTPRVTLSGIGAPGAEVIHDLGYLGRRGASTTVARDGRWTLPPIDISNGEARLITLIHTPPGGTETRASTTVKRDGAAPGVQPAPTARIWITEPQPGRRPTVVSQNRIVIWGVATRGAEIVLLPNESRKTTTDAVGRWTMDLPLAAGDNPLRFGERLRGLQLGVATITLRYDPDAPREAGDFAITDPEPGAEFSPPNGGGARVIAVRGAGTAGGVVTRSPGGERTVVKPDGTWVMELALDDDNRWEFTYELEGEPTKTEHLTVHLLTPGQSRDPRNRPFTITGPDEKDPQPSACVTVRGTGTPGKRIVWDIPWGSPHSGLLAGGAREEIADTVDDDGRWSFPVRLIQGTDGKNKLAFYQAPHEDRTRQEVELTFKPGFGVIDLPDPLPDIDTQCWAVQTANGVGSGFGAGDAELPTALSQALLRHDDISQRRPGLLFLHRLTDEMVTLGGSLALVLATVLVLKTLLSPSRTEIGLLRAIIPVGIVLGGYYTFARLGFEYSSALAQRLLTVDESAPLLANAVTGIDTPYALLTAFLRILVTLGLLVLLGVKLYGQILLFVLFPAGPALLPLALVPALADGCRYWWTNVAKVLSWPILWAFLLKIMVALHATVASPAIWGDSPVAGLAAALAPLFVIALMFLLPFKLSPSPGQARRGVGIVRGTFRVGAAGATGGATVVSGATLRAASAARGASRAAYVRWAPQTGHPTRHGLQSAPHPIPQQGAKRP